MKTRPETIERDKKIARLYDSGYTLKEIYEMKFQNIRGNNLSKKYIQRCIRDNSKIEYQGKITDSKLFSLRDLENILLDSKAKDEIVKKRVIDHYKKLNNKYLDKEPKNDLEYKGKLRAIVFQRDNYKCVECGSSIGLECIHEIYKEEYENIEDEVGNCLTLCYNCHREVNE
jgi:hypothetical protein